METIKRLNSTFSEGSKILIVTVLALAGLVTAFSPQTRLFDYFLQYSALFLFGLVAIYAQYKGYSLLSFTILLMIFYPGSISGFMDAIFQLLSGRVIFTLETFIQFFIGVFLLLMIISIIFGGIFVKPKLRDVDMMFIGLGFLHVLIFNNMIASVNGLLLIIIALLMGSRRIAALLFVVKYIMTPLNYIDNIIQFDNLSVAFHLRSITGILVLIVMIAYSVMLFSENNIE